MLVIARLRGGANLGRRLVAEDARLVGRCGLRVLSSDGRVMGLLGVVVGGGDCRLVRNGLWLGRSLLVFLFTSSFRVTEDVRWPW